MASPPSKIDIIVLSLTFFEFLNGIDPFIHCIRETLTVYGELSMESGTSFFLIIV